MPDSISVNNTFIFIADDGDLQSISYGGLWEHDTNRTGYMTAYEDTGSIGTLGATATMQFSGEFLFPMPTIPAFPLALHHLAPMLTIQPIHGCDRDHRTRFRHLRLRRPCPQ